MIRVSKMLTKSRLLKFTELLNAEPGAYIEREVRIGEFWMVTIVVTGHHHAEALRLFDPGAED